MTMRFETIRDALVSTLGAAAAGRFTVVSYQRQSSAAEEARGSNCMVQVFYKSGDFPKSGGSVNGPTEHEIAYDIEFIVSAPASVDLSTLNDSGATAGAKQAALAALQESAAVADRLLDGIFGIVYQILMDARNMDLGLTVGIVKNRWLDSLQKDQPIPQGELVVLTGSARYSCRTQEPVPGDTGTEPTTVYYDSSIGINDDPVQQTEVEVNQ